MQLSIGSAAAIGKTDNVILVTDEKTKLSSLGLSKDETALVKRGQKNGLAIVEVPRGNHSGYVLNYTLQYKGLSFKLEQHEIWEEMRKAGATLNKFLNKEGVQSVVIANHAQDKVAALLVTEGLALANYQFLKYKRSAKDEANSLKSIKILKGSGSAADIRNTKAICEAVYATRDLVNEPQSFLTAPQLAKEIQAMGKKAGFKVQVFNKAKIQALKMGGLLAVNKGSLTPPTFTVLEYKPKNPKNKKPIVLVGKGVVYDTGGLSLKPTKNSMDWMKSDMAGAAAVAGTFYAAAKTKMNLHIIGLIPATDNRPDGNAYAPGDVIKMHNGSTVEVWNTDAEGRMLLADALSYAQQYKPQLVMDFATLTGAALVAIGHMGIAYMGTADSNVKEKLEEAGRTVYERLVNFPLWKEYDEEMRSDIADVRNIGGPYAGQITAGKFLQRFTDYPWIHFDIAPSAFITGEDSYRGKWGTGVGVRLMYQFLLGK